MLRRCRFRIWFYEPGLQRFWQSILNPLDLILDCRNVLLEGSCLWVLRVIECGAAAAVRLSMCFEMVLPCALWPQSKSAVDATKDLARGFKMVFGRLGVGARISARAQTL